MKLTKQGVRNLDSLPEKSGKKIVIPPKESFVCPHHKRRKLSYMKDGEMWMIGFREKCLDCGEYFDW